MQNEKGQGVSHITESQVPQMLPEKVRLKLENELPDIVHSNGSNIETGKVSHAVDGYGMVLFALQEALSEKVGSAERDAIHNPGPKERLDGEFSSMDYGILRRRRTKGMDSSC
jgi:hypothetical protein